MEETEWSEKLAMPTPSSYCITLGLDLIFGEVMSRMLFFGVGNG